jgi:hypothetical protein
MKKRTIVSLVIAALIFAVIILQIQMEAKADSEAFVSATVMISNGLDNANYSVVALNETTWVYYVLDRIPGKKPPQYRGNVTPGNYTIRVCSSYNHGKITAHVPFNQVDQVVNINITPICPEWDN